jgi:hypothetical protein
MKDEYHDREILERAAEVEAEQWPYEYNTAGVEYDDVTEYFEFDDFGINTDIMIPNRLKQLSVDGYLNQVSAPRAASNASYRLTNLGWQTVDADPPDA